MKRQIVALFALLWTTALWAGTAWRPAERWRGFNIDGRAIKGAFSGEWREDDLRQIHEFGFNFVRVMVDYRYLCRDDDWTMCDAAKFGDLDTMLDWGRKYAIHVQFCLSFPPGIDVKTKSKAALFHDPKVGRVLARYWAFFAARYRDVPNERLSFNLFNEPDASATAENYRPLIEACVKAIRAEDPKRFVVADGLATARAPVPGVDPALDVGQSLHIYDPMTISHYLAPWCRRTEPWPVPSWPPPILSGPLFGDRKKNVKAPLVILDVPASHLSLEVGLVNRLAEVVVRADAREIMRVRLQPSEKGEGYTNLVRRTNGEWAGVLVRPLEVDVPACRSLEIDLDRGDWMSVTSLSLSSGGRKAFTPVENAWRKAGDPVRKTRFAGFDAPIPFVKENGQPLTGEDYLCARYAAWDKLLAEGCFVMVGETGGYNKTPHAVTLAWLESILKELKKRNIGWAMWNFRGTIGIIDSKRADVQYEDFHGHKLDRQMLELLQRY